MNVLKQVFRVRASPPPLAKKRAASEEPESPRASKKVKRQLFDELDNARSRSDVNAAWRRALRAIDAQRATAKATDAIVPKSNDERAAEFAGADAGGSSHSGAKTPKVYAGDASTAGSASKHSDFTTSVAGSGNQKSPQTENSSGISGDEHAHAFFFAKPFATHEELRRSDRKFNLGEAGETASAFHIGTTDTNNGKQTSKARAVLTSSAAPVLAESDSARREASRPLREVELSSQPLGQSCMSCTDAKSGASVSTPDLPRHTECEAELSDAESVHSLQSDTCDQANARQSYPGISLSESEPEWNARDAYEGCESDAESDSDGKFCALFGNEPSDDSSSDFDPQSMADNNAGDETGLPDEEEYEIGQIDPEEFEDSDSAPAFYRDVKLVRALYAKTVEAHSNGTSQAPGDHDSSSSQDTAAKCTSSTATVNESKDPAITETAIATANQVDCTTDSDSEAEFDDACVTAVRHLTSLETFYDKSSQQSQSSRDRDCVVVSDSSSEEEEEEEEEEHAKAEEELEKELDKPRVEQKVVKWDTENLGEDSCHEIDSAAEFSELRRARGARNYVGAKEVIEDDYAEEEHDQKTIRSGRTAREEEESRPCDAGHDGIEDGADDLSSDSAPEECTSRAPPPATWEAFWANREEPELQCLETPDDFDGEVDCILSNGAKVYVYALEGHEDAKKSAEERHSRKSRSKLRGRKRRTSHEIKKEHGHRSRTNSDKSSASETSVRRHKRKHLRWHDE